MDQRHGKLMTGQRGENRGSRFVGVGRNCPWNLTTGVGTEKQGGVDKEQSNQERVKAGEVLEEECAGSEEPQL